MINLKEERMKAGLTQRELADLAGNVVTRNQIHNIEAGKTKVSIPTAKALADVLKFEWTRFFDEDESKGLNK